MKILLIVVALGPLLGCNVTETGNPPAAPEVEPNDIVVSYGFVPDLMIVRGTVRPAEGQVTVTNLDRAGARATATVDGTGAFEISLEVILGEELRFQAVSSVPGVPIDRLVAGDAENPSLEVPVRAYADCLSIPTLLELPQQAELLVENRCSEAVAFGQPRWLVASETFGLTPSTLPTLNPGDSARIALEPQSSPFGVLIIEAESAVPDRRAVSVHRAP